MNKKRSKQSDKYSFVLEVDLESSKKLAKTAERLIEISGHKLEKLACKFIVELFEFSLPYNSPLVDQSKLNEICLQIGDVCTRAFSIEPENRNSPFVALLNQSELGVSLPNSNEFRCLKFNIAQSLSEKLGTNYRPPELINDLFSFKKPYLPIAAIRSSTFRSELCDFISDPNQYLMEKILEDLDHIYQDDLLPTLTMLPNVISFNGISMISSNKILHSNEWLGENTGYSYDPVTNLSIVKN